MTTFNQYVSPWLDAGRRREVPGHRRPGRGAGRVVLVGCHTPVIGRDHVDRALAGDPPLAVRLGPAAARPGRARRRSRADNARRNRLTADRPPDDAPVTSHRGIVAPEVRASANRPRRVPRDARARRLMLWKGQ